MTRSRDGAGLRPLIVRGLAWACRALDEILYRPAVVKATMWLPRWWTCELAKISVALDDRWNVGYWPDGAPDGTCEVCGRRAAWLEFDHAGRSVSVCGWCPTSPFTQNHPANDAFAASRARSIRWSWRWPNS